MTIAPRAARIACVHAMRNSLIPTARAFESHWPEAYVQNVVDDSLSIDVAKTGLDAEMDRRFQALADYSVSCDVDAVLFTCSAFGTCTASRRDA